ncbi:MAG: malonate transporter subunit MadM [Flavobacteriaceae bacterium]|nr:malonate transporter subunit MadM [Flavobacteriaceae bacterium]
MIEKIIDANGLVFAFFVVGIIMYLSYLFSNKILNNKIPGAAIAIIIALGLAFLGDEKGVANLPYMGGMAILGGSMLRDFSVVATAMGVDIVKIKNAGVSGIISLLIGITFSFTLGVLIAFFMGYSDSVSLTTIGAGACTYIVGPVTGSALGASSEIIALSVATGVVKVIVTSICTPLVAGKIGLNNPNSAMVFGGLIGTTSGVAAGLAATDEKLVPYGALTATFYTGLGCLLCPSIFYFIILAFFK